MWAALLCGMLNVIFHDALVDEDFCRAHVDGVDTLRTVVEPFSPI
jgi:anaerobic selenocysteine-containing dehydrogenase